MANLQQALEYAAKNPDSDFAKELTLVVQSGKVDNDAKELGIDLTPIKSFQSQPQKPEGQTGVKGFATGIGKGVLSTATGLGTLGGKVLSNLPGKAGDFFEGGAEMGKDILKSELLKGQTGAEKLGKGVEQVGEFMIGGGAVAGATKTAGIATKIGTQVASDVAIQSAQQGNLEDTGKQAILTAGLSSLPLVGPLLGKLGAGKVASKIATNIEKMNLRLSPIDQTKLAKKGDEVASYLAEKKIVGTPEQRFAKIDNIYNEFENKVQKTLTDVTEEAKRIKYSKNEVIKSIKDLPDRFLSEANDPQVYDQLTKDTKKFIEFIKKQKGDFIDASKINAYKRTYAKSARNKAGDVVMNDSREALSDGLYNLILKDNPALQKINEEYGKVILARKLMGKALGRNELGLIGNLVGITTGGLLGSAVGGPVGSAIGAAAGPKVGKVVAGTKARSMLGSRIQSFGDYLKSAKVDDAGNFLIPRSIINGLFKGQ